MSESRWLRARTVADEWFAVFLVVSLVLAGAGAFVTHGAHVEPGTHQEQRIVDEWSTRGSFTHAANVTSAARGTPFEPNTVVQNREAYFQSIMPVLQGQFEFRTPGVENRVDVSTSSQLVVRSIDGGDTDQEQTVYWEQTRSLGSNETVHRPGEATTLPFRLNVSRTSLMAENVSRQLGSPGEVQIRILVTVVATRQAPDGRTRRFNYSLTIEDQSGIYRPQSEPSTQTFTETETVTVPNEPGRLRTVGGPLLLALGLLSTVGFSVGRWREWFAVSERERDRLVYLNHRAEFDEWITTIELPEEASALPVARADTLADLVDFAIDTDSAVVEDPNGESYHVVHDDYRYTFQPPPASNRDTLLAPESNETPESNDATAAESVDTEMSGDSDEREVATDGDESASTSDEGAAVSDDGPRE